MTITFEALLAFVPDPLPDADVICVPVPVDAFVPLFVAPIAVGPTPVMKR